MNEDRSTKEIMAIMEAIQQFLQKEKLKQRRTKPVLKAENAQKPLAESS